MALPFIWIVLAADDCAAVFVDVFDASSTKRAKLES